MFMVLCGTHLITTEPVPAQRSRGEVLLYQRKSSKRTKSRKDEETGDLVGHSATTSLQDTANKIVNVNVKEESRITGIRAQLQKDRAVFHWNNVNYSI
jgi:ATP-binding cassette subfamily G (WHITE) protein 2 (PDR)